MPLLCRAPHREPTPPISPIRPRPPLRHRATRPLRPPYRLPPSSSLGRAEEQPPPLAPNHLLLIMASGPAGPLVHTYYHPAAGPTPATASGRRYDPRSCGLACPDDTHPVRPRPRQAYGNSGCKTFYPLLKSRPPQRPTWMPSALLPSHNSEILPHAIRTLIERGNNRPSLRATTRCGTSLLAGRQPYQTTLCHVPLRTSAPPFR